MGVLETRNLDFRNLLMLSVNEGQLPKKEGDSSFIPYNLRKAFGMTTIEHKNAVYAYYFYRLIQRAGHVTMLYNTASEGLNRGEMSRFMLQYLVEKSLINQTLQAVDECEAFEQCLLIELLIGLLGHCLLCTRTEKVCREANHRQQLFQTGKWRTCTFGRKKAGKHLISLQLGR